MGEELRHAVTQKIVYIWQRAILIQLKQLPHIWRYDPKSILDCELNFMIVEDKSPGCQLNGTQLQHTVISVSLIQQQHRTQEGLLIHLL